MQSKSSLKKRIHFKKQKSLKFEKSFLLQKIDILTVTNFYLAKSVENS